MENEELFIKRCVLGLLTDWFGVADFRVKEFLSPFIILNLKKDFLRHQKDHHHPAHLYQSHRQLNHLLVLHHHQKSHHLLCPCYRIPSPLRNILICVTGSLFLEVGERIEFRAR